MIKIGEKLIFDSDDELIKFCNERQKILNESGSNRDFFKKKVDELIDRYRKNVPKEVKGT